MTIRSHARCMLFLACLAAAAATLLSSCGGGGEEEKKAKEQKAAAAIAAAAPKEPEIPKVYDDAAWQERFKFWYLKLLEEFNPVEDGMNVRLAFTNGEGIVGEFMGFTNTAIAMTTLKGATNYPPEILTQDTRERLIREEFAISNAKRIVDAEKAKDPAHTPTGETPVVVEGQPVLEQRFSSSEGRGLDLRLGPGKNFKEVLGTQVQMGSMISVLEEYNGWIRFVAPDADGKPVSVWMNKFATIPVDSVNIPQQEKDIQSLTEKGIILAFSPTNNEVTVNAELWNDMDLLVRQGIGRTLAYYCGTKRATGLNWVEFKDKSGKRIAKYSEALGFKIYQN